MDSAVITVGHLYAGTVNNIIPNEAVMEGTIRTQDPETRKQVAEYIGQLAVGTAKAMGAEDFAYYLEHVPGALFRLGTFDETPESHWALHNPSTLFNETCIPTGGGGNGCIGI